MALSGTFTFKKNETINCPISIDNVASHGSKILVLRIDIPSNRGILTSAAISGVVGVYARDIGRFEVVGTATQINAVLATTKYQNSGTLGDFQGAVELRALDSSNLYTGSAVISATISFKEYAWPAVSWVSPPPAAFNVPKSAAAATIRFPKVTSTNVGLLSAVITPITEGDDQRGVFVVSESSRDLAEIKDSNNINKLTQYQFRGSAESVNAWLQSVAWKPTAFTDVTKYKIVVGDGRTSQTANAEFSIVPQAGLSVPSSITVPNSGTVDPTISMAGQTLTGANTITLTAGGTSSIVWTSTATAANVTLSISGNVLTVTATSAATAANINTVLGGILLAAGSGAASNPNIVINAKLQNSVSGLLDDRNIPTFINIRFSNMITRTWTEDQTHVFNPTMQVGSANNTDTLTLTLTAAGNFGGEINSTVAGGSWNSTNQTFTVSGTTSFVNSVLTGLRYVPLANWDQSFTINVAITNSNNDFSGSFAMTANPIAEASTMALVSSETSYQVAPSGAGGQYRTISGTFDDVDTAGTFTFTISCLPADAMTLRLYNLGLGTGVETTNGIAQWPATNLTKANIVTLVTAANNSVRWTPLNNLVPGGTLSQTVSWTEDVSSNAIRLKVSRAGLYIGTTQFTVNVTGSDGFTASQTIPVTSTNNGYTVPTATFTFTYPSAVGKLVASSGSYSVPSAGQERLTISGTSDQINAALNTVRFDPTANYDQSFTISTVYTINGTTATGTVNMNCVAVPDPQVLIPSNQSYNFNNYAFKRFVYSGPSDWGVGTPDPLVISNPLSMFDPDTIKESSYSITVRNYYVNHANDYGSGVVSYYEDSTFEFTGTITGTWQNTNSSSTQSYYQTTYTGTYAQINQFLSSAVFRWRTSTGPYAYGFFGTFMFPGDATRNLVRNASQRLAPVDPVTGAYVRFTPYHTQKTATVETISGSNVSTAQIGVTPILPASRTLALKFYVEAGKATASYPMEYSGTVVTGQTVDSGTTYNTWYFPNLPSRASVNSLISNFMVNPSVSGDLKWRIALEDSYEKDLMDNNGGYSAHAAQQDSFRVATVS